MLSSSASSLPSDGVSTPDGLLLLSKYERARLVAARVKELEDNAQPVAVDDDAAAGESLFAIALREVDCRLLPGFSVRRHFPGGRTPTLCLSRFPVDEVANAPQKE